MLLIEHFGITVKDLPTSVRFYSALFDARPIERMEWRGKDAEYVAEMMRQPGLTLDAAFFRIPGSNAILELIQFHDIADGEGTPVWHYQTSGTHLGFYVEDIDAVAARLRPVGVEFLTKPVTIQAGPYRGTGGRSTTFRDPDGINLQLMEISGRPGHLPLPAEMDVART